VAPSPLAFRRHLIVRHSVELVRGRGPAATEVFMVLPEEEASRRRFAVSHRQGGRGPRRTRQSDVRQPGTGLRPRRRRPASRHSRLHLGTPHVGRQLLEMPVVRLGVQSLGLNP